MAFSIFASRCAPAVFALSLPYFNPAIKKKERGDAGKKVFFRVKCREIPRTHSYLVNIYFPQSVVFIFLFQDRLHFRRHSFCPFVSHPLCTSFRLSFLKMSLGLLSLLFISFCRLGLKTCFFGEDYSHFSLLTVWRACAQK